MNIEMLGLISEARALIVQAAAKTNHLELLIRLKRAAAQLDEGVTIYKHQPTNPRPKIDTEADPQGK